MIKKEIKRLKVLSIKALMVAIHFSEPRMNIKRKSNKIVDLTLILYSNR